jgi:cytochrome oxidase Cu insertion factor (SCO1/SenC/PrrC family)
MNTRAPPPRRSRRTLIVIALVAIAPVVASYATYYWFPREKLANYGELLVTRPAPEVTGTTLYGKPFRVGDLRGRWVLAVAAPAACDASCVQALYAMRQARTMQNAEMDRIVRVWLVTGEGTPDPALLAQHPDLTLARIDSTALAAWDAGSDRIYLLDPLGNLVLAYPRDPDIKGVARDLTRLLKASRIG